MLQDEQAHHTPGSIVHSLQVAAEREDGLGERRGTSLGHIREAFARMQRMKTLYTIAMQLHHSCNGLDANTWHTRRMAERALFTRSARGDHHHT